MPKDNTGYCCGEDVRRKWASMLRLLFEAQTVQKRSLKPPASSCCGGCVICWVIFCWRSAASSVDCCCSSIARRSDSGGGGGGGGGGLRRGSDMLKSQMLRECGIFLRLPLLCSRVQSEVKLGISWYSSIIEFGQERFCTTQMLQMLEVYRVCARFSVLYARCLICTSITI